MTGIAAKASGENDKFNCKDVVLGELIARWILASDDRKPIEAQKIDDYLATTYPTHNKLALLRTHENAMQCSEVEQYKIDLANAPIRGKVIPINRVLNGGGILSPKPNFN
jgi:hypothetical protein